MTQGHLMVYTGIGLIAVGAIFLITTLVIRGRQRDKVKEEIEREYGV